MIMEWKSELVEAEIKAGDEIFKRYTSYVVAIKSVAAIEKKQSAFVAVDISDYMALKKVFANISNLLVEQEAMLTELLDGEEKKEKIKRQRSELERRHHDELSKNYFEEDFFDKAINKLGIKDDIDKNDDNSDGIEKNSANVNEVMMKKQSGIDEENEMANIFEKIKGRKHSDFSEYNDDGDIENSENATYEFY